MATAKEIARRKRKRKARTEVSSSSSSSDTDTDTSPPRNTSVVPKAKTNASPSAESSEEDQAPSDPPPPALATQPTSVHPEQAFEAFYLRQATREFAADLDKLRAASDFGPRSVGVLVEALKQGTACFGEGRGG